MRLTRLVLTIGWVIATTSIDAVETMAARVPDERTVPLSLELPDNPTIGARLFVEKGCVRCHALGGESRLGPDLGRIHFKGTVLDLAGSLWNHAPMMREKMADLKIQPATLTSREMADLLAFLTAYRYYLTELGQPGTASAGRAVFEAKGCARCHGDRNARDKPGPSLDRYRGRFSAINLAQMMWNHSPEMASAMRARRVEWPRFAGREMGDLLAYLQAGNAGTAGDRVYLEPGSPRRGRELFLRKRCINCHAIAGIGGRGGPDLGTRGSDLIGSVSSIAGRMWNHSQGMMAEFRRRGLARASFSGQEMADIIAYLYFVNYGNVRGSPARGGEVFVGNCSPCHTIGGGKQIGPDLLVAADLDEPIAILAAMWNHASTMSVELRKRTLAWPRFESGEVADLTAFLLSRRNAHAVRKLAS